MYSRHRHMAADSKETVSVSDANSKLAVLLTTVSLHPALCEELAFDPDVSVNGYEIWRRL